MTTPNVATQSTPTGAQATSSTGDHQSSQNGSPQTDQNRATDGRFAPSEWRYPADFEVSYLRGKTAAEGAQLLDAYYRAALAGQPRAPSAPAAPAAPVASPATPPSLPTDEEWAMNPAAAFQKAALATMQSQYQPVVQNTLAQLAQTNRALVQRDRADEFRRWGPEIELELQRITDPTLATVQNLGLIVDMVASRHRAEIVAEEVERRLQERLAAGGGGFRPDGSVAGGGTSATPTGLLNLGELPEELRTVLEATRMTDATFAEFLRTYYGPNADLQTKAKEWLTKAKESRSGVITNFQMRGSGGRPGYQMERSSSRT